MPKVPYWYGTGAVDNIADWRLPIRLNQDPIENRQLEIGNVIGRYRSRTVPSSAVYAPLRSAGRCQAELYRVGVVPEAVCYRSPAVYPRFFALTGGSITWAIRRDNLPIL